MKENSKTRGAQEKSPTCSETVKVERLEERIALSVISPKKAPEAPPYPPGTRYSLASRENLPGAERPESARRSKPEVEQLEERVALSVISPKKAPEAPPYPPGTKYSLAERKNLTGSEAPAASDRAEKTPVPQVEELEERAALSVIVPKKAPEAPPYPPGTLYGLARRENVAGWKACGASDRPESANAERPSTDKSPAPEMEELEERVALSVIIPKKSPEPPPYPPGADYSLAMRENLRW